MTTTTTNETTSPGACRTGSSRRCTCSATPRSTICGKTLPRATGSPSLPSRRPRCARSAPRPRPDRPGPSSGQSMCGRFAQPRSPDELARIFHARRSATWRATSSTSRPPTRWRPWSSTTASGWSTRSAGAWSHSSPKAPRAPLAADQRAGRDGRDLARPSVRPSTTALHRPRRGVLRVAPAPRPGTGRMLRSEPFAIRRRTGTARARRPGSAGGTRHRRARSTAWTILTGPIRTSWSPRSTTACRSCSIPGTGTRGSARDAARQGARDAAPCTS